MKGLNNDGTSQAEVPVSKSVVERILENCKRDRNGHLIFQGKVTGDRPAVQKIDGKQYFVRAELFRAANPQLSVKRVYDKCGVLGCIDPKCTTNEKPSKSILEKLCEYVEHGPLKCHFPRNWNGKNEYYEIHHEGRAIAAHRAVDEYHNGPIPEGIQVHHTCNNKPCFRREHLKRLTPKENIAQAVADGRFNVPRSFGEQHGNAKLNNAEILDIRFLKQQGIKTKEIAQALNIGRSYIPQLIRREKRDDAKSLGKVTIRIEGSETSKIRPELATNAVEISNTSIIHLIQDRDGIAAYVKSDGSPRILNAVNNFLARQQLKLQRSGVI